MLSPASAAVGMSNALSVGQVLRPYQSDPNGFGIVSTNSEYRFGIYYNATTHTSGGGGLSSTRSGPTSWPLSGPSPGCATAQAYAVLRPNGNFVLYSEPGVAMWSTHTAGTGNNNRLVMRNDGNLVMYTGAGRAVWSSGTHAEVLSSGDRLRPGQHLTNVYSHSDPPTTLSMQRDGELVLRFHGAVLWASNTSVRGSYLLMQPDGDLVIQHAGRTLWRSGTGRLATPADGRPFLDVMPSGRFTVDFTPPDDTGGPAVRRVFDSARRPGESGRVASGALHFMTVRSVLQRPVTDQQQRLPTGHARRREPCPVRPTWSGPLADPHVGPPRGGADVAARKTGIWSCTRARVSCGRPGRTPATTGTVPSTSSCRPTATRSLTGPPDFACGSRTQPTDRRRQPRETRSAGHRRGGAWLPVRSR